MIINILILNKKKTTVACKELKWKWMNYLVVMFRTDVGKKISVSESRKNINIYYFYDRFFDILSFQVICVT